MKRRSMLEAVRERMRHQRVSDAAEPGIRRPHRRPNRRPRRPRSPPGSPSRTWSS